MIHEVAQLALRPSATRDRLTEGCYLTDDPNDPAGRIEHAFNLAINAEALETKFKKLMKEDKLSSRTHEERMQEAVEKKLLTEAEGEQLHELWLATREAIRVDHFTNKELNRA